MAEDSLTHKVPFDGAWSELVLGAQQRTIVFIRSSSCGTHSDMVCFVKKKKKNRHEEDGVRYD